MDSKREKKIHLKLVSREVIKPSTPTPFHLQNHKISLLQQFGQPCYTSVICAYPPPPPKNSNLTLLEFSQYSPSSIVLKKSLSETLTRFYPLAGRFIRKENILRCNDEGVDYLEDRVEGGLTVSELINDQPSYIESLHVLCAKTHELLTLSSDEVLVAIQANFFECGGVAIALAMAHNIADGSTLATFLQCWASISRHHHRINPVSAPAAVMIYPTFDAPDVLPPTPPETPTRQEVARTSERKNSVKTPIYTMKKFVFSGWAIAALKAAAASHGGNNNNKNNIVPSRTEAVIALIWKCLILALYDEKNNKSKSSSTQPTSVMIQSVDLRSRMAPPLPDVSFGNLVKAAVAAWPPNGNHDDVSSGDDDEMFRMLVKQLRDSTSRIDDAYAKNTDMEGLGCLGIPLHQPFTKIFTDQTEKHLCGASSVVKFPFYAVDFGWGDPVWVAPPKFRGEAIMLFGNKNAVEAWVCLEDVTMRIFEKNHELLAFCSESIGSRL